MLSCAAVSRKRKDEFKCNDACVLVSQSENYECNFRAASSFLLSLGRALHRNFPRFLQSVQMQPLIDSNLC